VARHPARPRRRPPPIGSRTNSVKRKPFNHSANRCGRT
jgi:hypothetical protein